jgi:hypothetical protein
MSNPGDPRIDRGMFWWWISLGATCVVTVTLLVTGLVVPGFLLDRGESSALPDPQPDTATPLDRARELPWALVHLDQSTLTPDAATAVVARQFMTRLNTGHVVGAVEMLCPTKRRPILSAVVWTARRPADLRIVTPLVHAARPGYITIRFAGTIDRRPRRGAFGIDANPGGQPRCVSAFYSVG